MYLFINAEVDASAYFFAVRSNWTGASAFINKLQKPKYMWVGTTWNVI